MGLSWQQGPLSPGAIDRFLVAEPMPKRLLYAEPLRRRMRVRFGGTWIADSELIKVSWSWLRRATCRFVGRAGPVFVTPVKAVWFRGDRLWTGAARATG